LSLREAEMARDQGPDALVRESLNNFTQSLRELVRDSSGLSEDERVMLGQEVERLGNSIDSLIKIVTEYNALAIGGVASEPFNPLGLVDLSSALAAVEHVAIRVFLSPITQRLEQEVSDARAAHARKARALVSKTLDRDILDYVKPLWEKHPTWKAGRLAAEFAESFNKDRISPLTDNAIEKRVRKLMRMRTTGQSSA